IDRPLFAGERPRRAALVLRTVFVIFWTAYSLFVSLVICVVFGNLAPRSPLYGIWNVQEFRVDGDVRPPLLTDTTRWQRVVLDHSQVFTIQLMNNGKQHYLLNLDTEKTT